ncbi:Uncharacterized pritein, DUF3786 [Desulfonema limicola]|uniref:Uncharacterized pritein, DUF3786 n=1 Tax=Desulfonema limicola TaxID=45656 RepID=A0A975B8L8_9BACT|nr:DUF3786 domain-containing protein [Desulfonema limicola]QTA80941.1 Uncharacterized pritein, DUF3786 [Desulfonema limicola]
MARTDDYINAKKLAVAKLSLISFEQLLNQTGFVQADYNIFRVPFLNRIYYINYPEFEFKDTAEPDKEIPIQEQVLILHYMTGVSINNSTNNWIAYREVEGAGFYFNVFVKRAIDPLKKTFGNNVQGLIKSANQLDCKEIDAGDAGFEFQVLPHAPVQVILWEGDEEFESEANILFKDNIGDYFSPEDIAWFAGMLVYRLISISYSK